MMKNDNIVVAHNPGPSLVDANDMYYIQIM